MFLKVKLVLNKCASFPAEIHYLENIEEDQQLKQQISRYFSPSTPLTLLGGNQREEMKLIFPYLFFDIKYGIAVFG